MLFSSLTFLLFFLPICLILYFLAPKKYRNYVLLVFSLFFYAWGEPIYVILMIFSIIANYYFGLKVEGKNKKWVTIAIITNLLIISYFKYAGLIVTSFNNVFNMSLAFTEPPLPIGISFFTFQALSYVIDVYRGETEVQKKLSKLALYVSLFPQLIAGPIVRYTTIHNEISNRKESVNKTVSGLRRFIIGLSKKVLLANQMGFLAQEILTGNLWDKSVYVAWAGVIFYGLQIYYDFSGYSDMAIGLGRIFGFKFLENFNYPYISRSISEFWRRWHISLGSWFRDYLYIPLGGNRRGYVNTLRNLFIVWFLTGLWHGASWNFVIWGLYFGVFIALEKTNLFKLISEKTPKAIMWLYSTIFVFASWSLFSIDNLSDSMRYFGKLFVNNFAINAEVVNFISYYLHEELLFIILSVISIMPIKKYVVTLLKKKSNKLYETGLYLAIPSCLFLLFIDYIYLINSSFNPFIYFRF